VSPDLTTKSRFAGSWKPSGGLEPPTLRNGDFAASGTANVRRGTGLGDRFGVSGENSRLLDEGLQRQEPSASARVRAAHVPSVNATASERPVSRRGQQTIDSDSAFPASRDNKNRAFAGTSRAGATGLEPATSGVTGHLHGHDDRRR
jgi:hypothetical protein